MQAKALDRIGVSANIDMRTILVPCIPILCDFKTLGEYIN